MTKRFISSEIFDDSWFMSLSKDAKLLWIYYITKCNHAGILSINEKLVEFQIGIKSCQTVIKELGKSLVTLKQDLYFCPKFILFQYPDFPKSHVKQQEGAIKILKSYNLWNEETNSWSTVIEELLKTYGNDSVTVNDSSKKEVVLWKDNYNIYKEECDKEYKRIVTDEFIREQQKYYPNINIRLSIEKGYKEFWSKEAGWKNKKSSKTKVIDWESTIKNSISINKVYLTRDEQSKINITSFNNEPFKSWSYEALWDMKPEEIKALPKADLAYCMRYRFKIIANAYGLTGSPTDREKLVKIIGLENYDTENKI